jgi:glycosyltransferase involved in cell wall biosynthesis
MSFEKTIKRPLTGGPSAPPDISFVIPFFDECESLGLLYQEIVDSCQLLARTFEIIFVDDGSRDGSVAVIRGIIAGDSRISLIRFRRNFGKSAALSAGFRVARGDVVFSLDADLQDDPAEIGSFLAELERGADCVSGWKQVRNDPVDKTLPSKLFNKAVNKAFGLNLNDHNCGFKAYRREALAELDLYGELHRFVPALLFARGFSIAQIPVNHRARQFGKSKFGAKRLVKGALDLMTVWLTTRYGARPLHLFGGGGIVLSVLGFAVLAYLSILWLVGAGPIGDRPLLLFGVLMVLAGGQLIGVGLLGELVLKRTISEHDKYSIAELSGALEMRAIERQLEALVTRE